MDRLEGSARTARVLPVRLGRELNLPGMDKGYAATETLRSHSSRRLPPQALWDETPFSRPNSATARVKQSSVTETPLVVHRRNSLTNSRTVAVSASSYSWSRRCAK